MANNKIEIVVTTDENHVPTGIQWSANDEKIKDRKAKAMALAMWDEESGSLMNMDLWTKDMNVEEMRHFICATMMTLADTFERATSDKAHAEAIKGFTKELAQRVGVLD
jgi:gliding motility-associated protein GldC